jgi:hypothetical protein
VNAGDKPYIRRPIAQITGEKLALLLPRHQLSGGAGHAIRRTAGVGHHVINRRMNVGDAMMVPGRGQYREKAM